MSMLSIVFHLLSIAFPVTERYAPLVKPIGQLPSMLVALSKAQAQMSELLRADMVYSSLHCSLR